MRSLQRQFGLAVALALWVTGAAWADPGDGPRAQMLTLRYEFGAGQQGVLANGVPLTDPRPAPALHAKQESGSSTAAVVLAIGVALALVVLVAGETAEDITDGKDGGPDDAGDCPLGLPGC